MTVLLNNWDYFYVYPNEKCVQEKIAFLIQVLCVNTFSSNIAENLEKQAKETEQQKSQLQSELNASHDSNINYNDKVYYYKCELWMFKSYILRFAITKLIQFSKIYNDFNWTEKRGTIFSEKSCANIFYGFIVVMNYIVIDYNTLEEIRGDLSKILTTSHVLDYVLHMLMKEVQRLPNNNDRKNINDCRYAIIEACTSALLALTNVSSHIEQIVKPGFYDTMYRLLCVNKERNNKFVQSLVVNLLTKVLANKQWKSQYNVSALLKHKKLMDFMFSYAIKPMIKTNRNGKNTCNDYSEKNRNRNDNIDKYSSNNNRENRDNNDDECEISQGLTGIVFMVTTICVDHKLYQKFIRAGMLEKILSVVLEPGDSTLYIWAMTSLIFFGYNFVRLESDYSDKTNLAIKYLKYHMGTFGKLFHFVSNQLKRFGDRCCGFCVSTHLITDTDDDTDGDSLLECKECRSVYYCCKSHQTLDLPYHKHFCSNIQKELQAGDNNDDNYKWQHTHTVYRMLMNIVLTYNNVLCQTQARKLTGPLSQFSLINDTYNYNHGKKNDEDIHGHINDQVKTVKPYMVEDVCNFIEAVCNNHMMLSLDYDKMHSDYSDKYGKWDKNYQNHICLSTETMILLVSIIKSINYLIEIEMIEKFDSCIIELLLKNAIQYLTTQKWDNKNINWNGDINIRNDIQYAVFMVAAKYCLYCLKNAKQASYCYGQAAKRANSRGQFIFAVRGLLYCRMYDFKCLDDIYQITMNQSYRLEQFCQQENLKESNSNCGTKPIHYKYLSFKIMEMSYGWFWKSNAQRYLTLSPPSRLKLIIKRIRGETCVNLIANDNSNLNLISLFSDLNNITILCNLLGLKECNWINCRTKNAKLKLCKCKQVYYCSKMCQKKDWSCNVYGVVPHRNKCNKRVCGD